MLMVSQPSSSPSRRVESAGSPSRSTKASAAAAIRSRDNPAAGLPCSLPRPAPKGRFGFAPAGGFESALDFIFVIKQEPSNLLQPYTGRLYEETGTYTVRQERFQCRPSMFSAC